MAPRSLVHNAADTEQVRYAERHNRRIEQLVRDDLRAALAHGPSRRVLMRILYEARCDFAHALDENPEIAASVWHPSAEIHKRAGARDLGLLLMGWIRMADPKALIEMLAEQLVGDQKQEREVDAAHTMNAADRERHDG